jgi:hypothetical protein
MGQLDSRHSPLMRDESKDPRQRLNLSIAPKAQISGADAPIGSHRSSFRHYSRSASHSTAAQVNQMPIFGKAVPARVLAHGRNQNAVREFNVAQPKRLE